MDFYQVIESRISNKNFKNTPIPAEKLNKIINAALMSPSWKNKTCYRFVFINQKNLKEQISATILNKSNEMSNAVTQAPILAVIVADPSQSGNTDNKQYFMVDCGIAMEHLVLAATNEGFGTCWIGSFEEEKVRNILNIPGTFRVVAMTPIGEATDDTEHFPPKDFSENIYFNNWNNTNRLSSL